MSLLRMIERTDGKIMSVYKLLTHLVDPSDFQLLSSSIDGIDISKLGLEDLRNCIVCGRECFFFR